MGAPRTLAVLSDVHYACAAERARNPEYEMVTVRSRLLRAFLRQYRRHVWLRDPLEKNHLLAGALQRIRGADWLVANGDYTCDSAFLGASDPAARESIRECVQVLRDFQGQQLCITLGDHELGKKSFFGGQGGMRLESWRQVTGALGLQGTWHQEIGRYHLIGVTSSLVALEAYAKDIEPEERPGWELVRREHLEEVRGLFRLIPSKARIVLFCHDPTALPWLAQEPEVRKRLDQVDQTVIGHLHSPLILWQSRLLAGMPQVHFLGTTIARMSGALRKARHWRPFKVRLCPSLAGVELLKDGGFLTAEIDEDAAQPIRWHRHRLPREAGL